MSAYGTPAAAGPTPGNLLADRRDWLRLLGGLLFAAGAVVLALRKSSDWSDWAIFAVLFIATLALYGGARLGSQGVGALAPWESAFYTFGIILLPLSLASLVNALDNSADGRINGFWILAVSAAIAVLTALRRGAWWQMLIAGLFATGSWIALWSKILDNPSADTIRWLLIAFAAILLIAAAALARESRPQAADLITAAGIAAVLAGALGIAAFAGGASGVSGLVSDNTPKPTQGWNVFLLLVSLALIAYGARSVTRGPGYVGAIGFTVFILLVGTDVVARLKGDEADKVVGWPLILLLVGAGALLVSFVMPRMGAGGPGAPPPAAPAYPQQQPPPPPPPAYGGQQPPPQ
jgi:hypothetical protein